MTFSSLHRGARWVPIALMLGSLGCAQQESAAPQAAELQRVARGSDRPTVDWGDAPFAARTLAQRLRARHTRDLPAGEPIDPHALRWVATHDRWMVVRARALSLADDASPEMRALIVPLLAEPATHPLMLCGALDASRAFVGDPEIDALRGQLQTHDDPRVRRRAEAP